MLIVQKDWTDMVGGCPIDIWDIYVKVKEYYRLIEVSEEAFSEVDRRMKLVEASLQLNSSKILVKNLVGLERNEYIKEQKEDYNWMIDNLNRVDKRIDEYQTKMIEQAGDALSINASPSVNARVLLYKKIIMESMENLVYFPLKKAYQKFKVFREYEETTKRGKKIRVFIKKDKNLFTYFLFLELFHTSEALGGIAREQTKMHTSKGHGVATMTPSRMPPEIPTNVEKKEVEIEEKQTFPTFDFGDEDDE